MAPFPASTPFPVDADQASFARRIREVGWAPCTVNQLLAFAEPQLAEVLTRVKSQTPVALRKAKAAAVNAWFQAQGLPEGHIEPDDFAKHASADRWITGIGLHDSDDDYFGIVQLGAVDLRSDGSFVMTVVYWDGLVERFDSRTRGPVLERLLLDAHPLALQSYAVQPNGRLIVGGFQREAIRIDARTLDGAERLPVLVSQALCPHGEVDADPDDAIIRSHILEVAPFGTLVEDCCGNTSVLPPEAGAPNFWMTREGFARQRGEHEPWHFVTGRDHLTVHRLSDRRRVAWVWVMRGTVAQFVLVDRGTLLTRSSGGVLQWWTLPDVSAEASESFCLQAVRVLQVRASQLEFLLREDGVGPFLLVRTTTGQLKLMDASSGAVIGELENIPPIERVVRTSARAVVLWFHGGDIGGLSLDPFQLRWRRTDQMAESQAIAVLPDGRLVRAAFGIVVEDPATGQVLESYGAPDLEEVEDKEPADVAGVAPPSTDRPPANVTPEELLGDPPGDPADDDRLAESTGRSLEESSGWGGTLYVLVRRPWSPLSRDDVLCIARWLRVKHDVLIDRIGRSLRPTADGEEYEWFLRVAEVDGVPISVPGPAVAELKARYVESTTPAAPGTTSPNDPQEQIDDCRRVLLMVAELHRLGYQQLRIVPFLYHLGTWRCGLTFRQNIKANHGALSIESGWHLMPQYSSASKRKVFGWEDVLEATPSRLAELFLARFPEVSRRGYGPDDEYVRWFINMLRETEPDCLPIAYQDFCSMPPSGLGTVGLRSLELTAAPLPPWAAAEPV